MNKHSKFVAFFLLIIVFSLTSCVLFRIIKVRNQLKNFQENFAIEEKDGLELVFKNPVLTMDDMIWIMKSDPTRYRKDNEYNLFVYELVKRYQDQKNEKGNFNIDLKMRFTDNKLHSMIFPERFLKYFSKSGFEKFMTSMGDTDIKKIKKTADSSIDSLSDNELPNIDNIEDLLGKPYSDVIIDGKNIYTYKYKTVPREKDDSPLYLKFEMGFNAETEKLNFLKAKIRGADVNINFANSN